MVKYVIALDESKPIGNKKRYINFKSLGSARRFAKGKKYVRLFGRNIKQ